MTLVALVDDDKNIVTSVSIFLESEGYQVQKYYDGVSALSGLTETPPDLAIFDIKMPRMDGMELLRKFRLISNCPVIFLTSKEDEFDEALGLHMGADDYIKKPFSQRLLGERIRAVLRRSQQSVSTESLETPSRKQTEGQISTQNGMVLDEKRHACWWKGEPVRLTVTEFLILKSLAQRPGYVKSRNQLMDEAYEGQIYVDDRTIDSHIKRVRKKFKNIDSSFDSIETLYGVGYRYKDTEK